MEFSRTRPLCLDSQSLSQSRRESVDVAFGDVAFQICENGVFKEKNVRLNSAGCEPHSRSDECFFFENPSFTLLKRHVRKRHVYRLPVWRVCELSRD